MFASTAKIRNEQKKNFKFLGNDKAEEFGYPIISFHQQFVL